MTSKEILEYYSDTANRDVRSDLIFAMNLITNEKIAIDCGCGAGADINYLRQQEFSVFAFDTEKESINRCNERFKNDDKVTLSQSSFISYDYPASSLIVADASLFFCPKKDFDLIWTKMHDSLMLEGIFCGSFLGPNDTMASPDYDQAAYWSNVLTFHEQELRSKFEKFEILKFTEHNVSGQTPQGTPHQWHIFSVVAKKVAR